jgi:acyl-CoA thioester hydrolase
MGRVYHSNYVIWMEEARTEWLRNRGINYKQMEEEGFFLPVRDIEIKYLVGVKYDELVCIKIFVEKISRLKIQFKYEFFDKKGEIKFAESKSTNVFTDKNGRPKRIEKSLLERIEKGEECGSNKK